MSKNRNERQTYVTAMGKTVEFIGVSPFEINEIQQLVELPPVPTRKIETAVPGYSEEEPLSEEDLRDDEERRIWTEYVRQRDAASAKRNELVTNFILLEGIRFDLDEMEAWKAKRKRWGLPVPDDEKELHLAYVKTAVIGSVEDVNNIVAGVVSKQGVDEATLKSIQSTFQRTVRRETAGDAAPAQGEVDLQPAHVGDESSPLVGGGTAD